MEGFGGSGDAQREVLAPGRRNDLHPERQPAYIRNRRRNDGESGKRNGLRIDP
jgi:hypothetical protein